MPSSHHRPTHRRAIATHVLATRLPPSRHPTRARSHPQLLTCSDRIYVEISHTPAYKRMTSGIAHTFTTLLNTPPPPCSHLRLPTLAPCLRLRPARASLSPNRLPATSATHTVPLCPLLPLSPRVRPAPHPPGHVHPHHTQNYSDDPRKPPSTSRPDHIVHLPSPSGGAPGAPPSGVRRAR